MGTSKSYDLPTGTNWSGTKTKFTQAAKIISESGGNPQVSPLLKGFFRSTGGSGSYSRGGSGFGNSRSAISAGHGLGSFFSEISENGISETIGKYFGERFTGKSVADICLELTDFFCDEVTFANDTDAKTAMYELMQELLEGVNSLDEIENVFDKQANDEALSELIERYFSLYIVEQIKRSFFGTLEKKFGSDTAKKLIEDQIKNYVIERTAEECETKDLVNLDYNSPESYGFIEEILQEVIKVFE